MMLRLLICTTKLLIYGNIYNNIPALTGYGYFASSGYVALADPDWSQNQYLIFAVQQTGNSTANVARSENFQVYKE